MLTATSEMDQSKIIANLYACGLTQEFAEHFVANATQAELIEATTRPDWALYSYWGANMASTLTQSLGGTGAEYRITLEAMGFRPEHIDWIDKDANMDRLQRMMESFGRQHANQIWMETRWVEQREALERKLRGRCHTGTELARRL
ncbi:hypothetical protein GALMADRAFT_244060 [Galerina marginata CBS 339.88]|uniref:Uncharacterized protein n=1 Tax=Galerina marginata (strain CBS 339.88) TaxID=685588 RepID=A0A067TI00_GALM3|nr:hypothetical protein GALMADRAFT_244060 [Galerina marginata CBS 339.88]